MYNINILHQPFGIHIIERPEDVVKDVFVLEFLKIPKPYNYSETELEARLIDN